VWPVHLQGSRPLHVPGPLNTPEPEGRKELVAETCRVHLGRT